MASASLGDFARAIATGLEALSLAECFGHAFSLLYSQGCLCHCHLERGELAEVLALAESGIARAREHGIMGPLAWLLAEAGHAQVLLGRATEGRALLEEARAVVEASPSWTMRCRIGVYLGGAYVHAGEIEQGCRCLERALALARAPGQRGVEAESRGPWRGPYDPLGRRRARSLR
jgi:tetratricopeptide (TPR) repeat protein